MPGSPSVIAPASPATRFETGAAVPAAAIASSASAASETGTPRRSPATTFFICQIPLLALETGAWCQRNRRGAAEGAPPNHFLTSGVRGRIGADPRRRDRVLLADRGPGVLPERGVGHRLVGECVAARRARAELRVLGEGAGDPLDRE